MFDSWVDYVEAIIRTDPHRVASMLIGLFLWDSLLTLWVLIVSFEQGSKRD